VAIDETNPLGRVRLGLPLEVKIGSISPFADEPIFIVQDQIPAIGAHHQECMALAVPVANHGHEKVTCRPAVADEFTLLCELVVLAIAIPRIRVSPEVGDVILLRVGHRLDRGVVVVVDEQQLTPEGRGEGNGGVER
jgi:hypothetical protein